MPAVRLFPQPVPCCPHPPAQHPQVTRCLHAFVHALSSVPNAAVQQIVFSIHCWARGTVGTKEDSILPSGACLLRGVK